MTEPPQPLEELREDVETAVRRRWHDVRWWLHKFVGAQLVKLLLGGAASVALVLAALPLFAAATAAVVVAAAVGYAIYARKQLVEERMMRRWAFVAGKRVQQEVLKRELALDLATLILVNNPKDRETAHRLSAPRSPEFASAVRYLRSRVAVAASAQRPRPAKAAMHGQARELAPPDLAVVRRRRDLRISEITKLEAEIQALAAPDAVELAVAAEDAKRSHKHRRAAVRLADRVARDRRRSGRTPTAPGPDVGLSVSFDPSGDRDVRPTRTQTPEQIARGEQPPEGSA